MTYYRPICLSDFDAPDTAFRLAGGWVNFTHVEKMARGGGREIVKAADIPQEALDRLTAPRAPICGLTFERTRLMGILNVTPDSFSDGGDFYVPEHAQTQAQAMAAAGADMIDIGGESTRPGADFVEAAIEIQRTSPVISALAAKNIAPISIDTRKACVAEAAVKVGAAFINDVSAFEFDAEMAETAARLKAPVCLMHAQGVPKNMQDDPSYGDVLLDVYDALAARVDHAVSMGIPKARIMVDPGIGFGKTVAHNLSLLRGMSLFHGLGCVVLLGASRKRFIDDISGAPSAKDRVSGSVAVAIEGVKQGVQMLRVHDTYETKQAVDIYNAMSIEGAFDGT
ncbi:MAG: dihydropteroate synthase [Halocynthiibacter sp.]